MEAYAKKNNLGNKHLRNIHDIQGTIMNNNGDMCKKVMVNKLFCIAYFKVTASVGIYIYHRQGNKVV